MKVLQINSVCGIGSTGRIAIDLYKVLEEQGHECLIAYGRGEAPEGINSYKIGSNLDNYLHVARTRLLDQHGFGSKKPTIELIKKIKKYNPDVIHLHNIHGYYLNIGILFDYLAKSDKKVVWTLHDCWAFTGHCAYFDSVKCNKWENGCYNCQQKKAYPSSYYFDNSYENYIFKKNIFTKNLNLNIVTVSDWLHDIVKKSFFNNNCNLITIKNGVNINQFYPRVNNHIRKKYQLDDKFIILGVSNVWDERKGLKDFIELSKKIEEDSIIFLVGLTSKQIGQLPRNIIGITKVSNIEELVDIYSTSDVFINTSVEETFGLVTVEALACGIPAIVYNTTASPELIEHDCGFIIEKNNISQLFNKVSLIKSNKHRYKDYCIKHVKKKYNQDDRYNEYIELYYQLSKQT